MQIASEKSKKLRRCREAGRKTQPELILPEALEMRFVRDLKQRLLALQASQNSCVIDAQNVLRVSTGCLQLLAAFARDMATTSQSVTLRKPPRILLESLQILGLSMPLTQFRMEH